MSYFANNAADAMMIQGWSNVGNLSADLVDAHYQKKAAQNQKAAQSTLLSKNKELRAQVESLLVALWDAAENGLIDDDAYNKIIDMNKSLQADDNERRRLLEKYDL